LWRAEARVVISTSACGPRRTGGREKQPMEIEIGEAAGKVWQAVHANGPLPKSRIAKDTGLSGDMVNQAIGWLAREGKVTREKKKKREVISLKQ